jgi:LysR family nitrogen assimilation transcriptional regulator
MPMNLNRIQLFIKVAEAGSISRAAPKVFLSQPALSLQIQALEEELKVRLFDRHNRGLVLTEEGKLLYERAGILAEWEEETLNILENQKKPAGIIRIGTYTTISSYLLPAKLKPFLDTYPEIELYYEYCSVDDAIEKLKLRELDMIIMSEIPAVDTLIKVPMAKDKLILVASGKNKFVPSRISPSELAGYRFLTYPHKYDYCSGEIESRRG